MKGSGSGFLDRLDIAGTAGSVFAAACCLGLAPLLAVLSALGLGFLIHDAVLLPLLIAFLGVTILGLWRGYRRHRRPGPLVVGLAASVAVLVFLFVWYQVLLAYVAISLLVSSTVWNVLARRRCEAKFTGQNRAQ